MGPPGTEQWSEHELVEAAKCSREAFATLYDRYVAAIYRYAYARTGSVHDAEDVTGETFRRALEHIHTYTYQGSPFGAWLYRIASNLIASRYRRAQSLELLDEMMEVADGDPQPEQVAMGRDEASSLWALVATLPPAQRRAVVLRFSHDLKIKDIAVAMDRSEASVKQLLYRAMVTLREKVKDYGRVDESQPVR